MVLNRKVMRYAILLWGIWMCCLTIGLSQESTQDFVRNIASEAVAGDRIQRIIAFEEERSTEMIPSYGDLLEEVVDYYLIRHWPDSALKYVNTLTNFYIFGSEVQHHKAQELLDQMVEYIQDLTESQELLTFYELNGELKLYQAQYRKAIGHFEEIIHISEALGDTSSTNFAYAHLKLGEIHSSLWNLMNSVTYFNEASRLFLDQKDSTMYLWCLSGLASLYGNNGLYMEADRLRTVIFEKGPDLNLGQIIAVAHTSAAIEKELQGRTDEQLFHLKMAEKYSRSESQVQTYIRSIILMLLTNTYAKLQQIDSTQYYFEAFSKIYDSENQGEWIENYFHIAEASVAFAMTQYGKAERIVLDQIKETRSNDNLAMRIRLYELLVRIYKDWNMKERGFEAIEAYQMLRDSLETIGISNRFLYFTQLFESEKKDKEILQQQASIRLLSERNKVLFLRLLVTILVLSAIFIILYLRRSRNFALQTNKLRESYSHRLIIRQEEERKKIAMDLHDGISQQLIFIKNQLDKEEKTEISNWVARSLEDLRNVSRSLHPEILKSFGLVLALEQLIDRLKKSTTLIIKKQIEEIDYLIDEDTELHIYRIVQEMLNNVVRHAQASHVWFRVRDFPTYIQFEVQDNGVGMREDLLNGFSVGIGLHSMRDRSKMIGGQLEIKSKEESGTHYILKYKKNETYQNSHSG